MNFKNLIGYQDAFNLAIRCFEISKKFLVEEKYYLTSQIRRSSRSVCSQIAEGYRERTYSKYFLGNRVDAHGGSFDAEICLDYAETFDCVEANVKKELFELNQEVD